MAGTIELKDHCAVLGVPRDAMPALTKRADRKLTRNYHPDVSKLPHTEERFKAVPEVNHVLMDAEKRAADDSVGNVGAGADSERRDFQPPPGRDAGFEFSGAEGEANASDHSALFEALFGRQANRANNAKHAKRTNQANQVNRVNHANLQDHARAAPRKAVAKTTTPGC